jgi:hypothetical protein
LKHTNSLARQASLYPYVRNNFKVLTVIVIMNRGWQKQYDNESLEKLFIAYLKAIQKSYIDLSKQHRIRIERWVEKLATVSVTHNHRWRRDRNAYAKLLLSMVVAKTLRDPFNQAPPDGPLPSFPTHIKFRMSEVAGIHESAFWSDLYQRLGDPSFNLVHSLEDSSRMIEDFADSRLANTSRRSNARDAYDRYHPPESRNGSGILTSEMESLNDIIIKQQIQIADLKQRMNDQTLHYELQLQRLRLGQNTSHESFRASHDSGSHIDFTQVNYGSPSRNFEAYQSDNSKLSQHSSSHNIPPVLPACGAVPERLSDDDFLAYVDSFEKDIRKQI